MSFETYRNLFIVVLFLMVLFLLIWAYVFWNNRQSIFQILGPIFMILLFLGAIARHFLYREYPISIAPGEAVRFSPDWVEPAWKVATAFSKEDSLFGYLRKLDMLTNAFLPSDKKSLQDETVKRETKLLRILMDKSMILLNNENIPLSKGEKLFQENNTLFLDAFLKRQEKLRQTKTFTPAAWRKSVKEFFPIMASRLFLKFVTPDKAPLYRLSRLEVFVQKQASPKILDFAIGLRATGLPEIQIPRGASMVLSGKQFGLGIQPVRINSWIRTPLQKNEDSILLFTGDTAFGISLPFAIGKKQRIGEGFLNTYLAEENTKKDLTENIIECRSLNTEQERCKQMKEATPWTFATILFFKKSNALLFWIPFFAFLLWFSYFVYKDVSHKIE